MLIDWFTVAAQAVNFIILVILMKIFLYKPILHAIDEREKHIAAELTNADKKTKEAREESAEFRQKNEELDNQRDALIRKAIDEAKTEGQQLLDAAREDAAALSAKQQETARKEEQVLRQTIGRRIQEEVFSIARKALSDLATVSLEESICGVFTRRLRELDSQAKASFVGAQKTVSGPALIRCAFDLSQEQRTTLQKALNETFQVEIPVRFETAPELIGGIELIMNGQKTAWSIEEYLASLERGVSDFLNEPDKPV